MKRLFTMLLVMLMVFAVACSSSSSVSGKYYHSDDDGSFLELRDDGSVWLGGLEGLESFKAGTYTVKSGNIAMNWNMWGEELTLKGTIKGKVMTLYDEDEPGDVEVFTRK